MPCLTVGLTGGIASGKSFITQMFSALGVPIVDADEWAHTLVKPGQIGLQQIVALFGETVLNESGELNRAHLRHVVFSDPIARQQLEAILHPLIWQAMQSQVAVLQTPYCILSIPLLLETQQYRQVNRILVVDCPTILQRQRLTARNGFQESEIDKILAAQATREARRAIADEIIDNSQDMPYAQQQVAMLHNFYQQWTTTYHIANA
jgi:dephospho-CoA kinase